MAKNKSELMSKSVQKIASGGGPVATATAQAVEPYTNQEISDAYDAALANESVKRRKKKQDDAAAPVMAEFLNDLRTCDKAGYKNLKVLGDACKTWFNKPSSFAEKVEEVPGKPLMDPAINFDSGHGDLHFKKKPTENKSVWTISNARAVMEAELQRWLGPLGTHSSSAGWTTFYVSAEHSTDVGIYVKGPDKPSTRYFSMQVQVNAAENTITYHGYPDEKMEGSGAVLGCKKSLKGPALS